jgi:hypothetical protein
MRVTIVATVLVAAILAAIVAVVVLAIRRWRGAREGFKKDKKKKKCGTGMRGIPPCYISNDPDECCKNRNLECDPDADCKDGRFQPAPAPGETLPTAEMSESEDLYTAMQVQTSTTHAHRAVLKLVREGDSSNLTAVKLYRLQASRERAHAASSVPFALAIARRAKGKTLAAAQAVSAAYQQAVEHDAAAQAAASLDEVRQHAQAAERARIDAQDSLLSAMADTDPVRPVKLPPRVVDVDDCGAYSYEFNTMTGDENRKLVPAQKRLLAYLEAKGKELLAHLLAKYPQEQYTKNLAAHWSRRVLPLSAEYEDAKFAWMATAGVRHSKCVFVNMSLTGSVPRSLTRLMHELSHISADSDGNESHTAKFYTAERWLLRIATEDLKWTTENRCREVCEMDKDTLQKDPKKACPKCTWQKPPELCKGEVNEELCNPSDDDPVGKTYRAQTAKDVPRLRDDAEDAARQASKMKRDIMGMSFPSSRAKDLALAQIARSVAANKRLQASRNASPEMVTALSQITRFAADSAENMLKRVKTYGAEDALIKPIKLKLPPAKPPRTQNNKPGKPGKPGKIGQIIINNWS